MRPWAAVVRVSHMGDRKAGTDTFHADREQLAPIEDWAAARGVRIEVMPPELGVSGGLPLEDRPSLLRAVEGVEGGDFTGIVVAYLSRLGRNVAEQLRVWDRVEAAGGQIVAIREGVDTSTAAGRLHRNLLISIDAHEREQHAERFEERRRLATQAGIWQRRQTPRGYSKGADRKLVLDGRAEPVRAAFRDYLGGASIVSIARGLEMSPSGVRQLLRNRVYLGELSVGQHTNREAHPPLIEASIFEATQERLDRNTRPGRTGREPALLAGLVRCQSCGHVMGRGQSNGGFAYVCRRVHSGGQCPRPAGIMTSRLDPYVEAVVLERLGDLEITDAPGGNVAEATAAREEAERELETFLLSVSAADIGAEAFGSGARQRREAVERATEAERAVLAQVGGITRLSGGAGEWVGLSVHERNTVLRSLLKVVIVRPAGRGKTVAVEDRARVLSGDADVALIARQPGGIVPLPFPDPDGDRAVWVLRHQDGAQSTGGLL